MDLPPPPYTHPHETHDDSTPSDPAPAFTSSSSSPGALPSVAARRTTETLPSPPWAPFKVGCLEEPLKKPWVTVEAAKCHLAFLQAFRRLKLRVEHHRRGVTETLSPDDRWLVFLHVATDRFTRWEKIFGDADYAEDLIPLDCLLVWHTLTLNPRWYREDMLRLHPNLTYESPETPGKRCVTGIRLRNIETRLDSDYNLPEAEDAAGKWLNCTETPHDPLENLSTITHRVLKCPKCLEPVAAPWVNEKDSGYGQKNFYVMCLGCAHRLRHETLGFKKMVDDLNRSHYVRYKHELSSAEARGAMAGTLVVPRESAYREGSSRVSAVAYKDKLLEELGPGRLELLGDMTWSLKRLHDWWSERFAIENHGGRTLKKMLSAYTTGAPYSIDVPQAILRQGAFIDKMHALGWTDPGFFVENDTALHRAQVRYHAFLDLAYHQRSKQGFVVPTLDIDLFWHTHMLDHESYYNDTRRGLDYFFDHDDAIEEGFLAKGFDNAASLWEARFGVPYSSCPCPRPSASGLSGLTQKLSLSSSSSSPPTATKKAPKGLDQGDLHSAEANEPTHPSEHQAVLVDRLAQVQRKLEYERQREKMEKKGKGKGKGKEKKKEKEKEKEKEKVGFGEEHQVAFMLDEHTASCAQLRSALEASQAGANIASVAGACGGGGCGAGACGGPSGYPKVPRKNPARMSGPSPSSRDSPSDYHTSEQRVHSISSSYNYLH